MSEHKPTRDAATSSEAPEEMHRRGAEGEGPDERYASGRREVGGAEESGKHRPHVTENDENAPLQEDAPAGREIPGLPANAAGRDEVPADESAIDRESAYDRRPEEHKDIEPSELHRD